MSALELEEAQGLTAEDVRRWLRAKGWRAEERRTLAQWWIVPREVSDLVSGIWLPHDDNEDREQLMDGLLRVMARVHGLTPQQLLREMNPRMRSWPSEAAIAAHNGLWLCCAGDETACMGRFDAGWFRHSVEHVVMPTDTWARFWPCDANGNKVRYPVDAKGVML